MALYENDFVLARVCYVRVLELDPGGQLALRISLRRTRPSVRLSSQRAPFRSLMLISLLLSLAWMPL